ncbi:MAG: rRNA maturation RNase YbeY [Patescibacteria group bacterium]|nr:rRNA maturation RNase YbeY [Patescibacteria group bacterium]
MTVEVRNLTSSAVDEQWLKRAAGAAVTGEQFDRSAEISFVLSKGSEIKTLNRKYKQRNCSTDVLTFGNLGFGENFVGEAVVCLDEVKKNGRKFGDGFKKELARVVIHGVLHLAGYDDKTNKGREAMKKKENFYLSKLPAF